LEAGATGGSCFFSDCEKWSALELTSLTKPHYQSNPFTAGLEAGAPEDPGLPRAVRAV